MPMASDISEDLDTTVEGVQTAITVFLIVMAALMFPSSSVTTDAFTRFQYGGAEVLPA